VYRDAGLGIKSWTTGAPLPKPSDLREDSEGDREAVVAGIGIFTR
jgi:hypothetical protein